MGCTKLTDIYCYPITPPQALTPSVELTIAADAKIYVPKDCIDVYKSTSGWSKYADKIVGYNF